MYLIIIFSLVAPILGNIENPFTKIEPFSAFLIEEIKITNPYAGFYKKPDSIQLYLKILDKDKNYVPYLTPENFRFYILPGGLKNLNEQFRVSNIKLKYFIDSYYFNLSGLPQALEPERFDLLVQVIQNNKPVITQRLKNSIIYSHPQVDIAFIIDTSGSMYKNDRFNYRHKIFNFVLDYASKTKSLANIAIIGFSTYARILLPLTCVSKKNNILNAIAQIGADGATNIGDGLEKAMNELEKSQLQRFAILLTDGENNIPYKNQHISYVDKRIPIFSVGLKDEVNDEFLNHISTATGGEYFKVSAASNLIIAYNQILERISQTDKSDFYIFPTLNRNFYKNEPVNIAVFSKNRFHSIKAQIKRPDGSLKNVYLFDNGEYDDGQPNDFIYSNYFFDTSVPGEYKLIFNIHNKKYFKNFYVSNKTNSLIQLSTKNLHLKNIERTRYYSKGFDIISKENTTVCIVPLNLKKYNISVSPKNYILVKGRPKHFDIHIYPPYISDIIAGKIIVASSIGTSYLNLTGTVSHTFIPD